jgi:hypothetical protein
MAKKKEMNRTAGTAKRKISQAEEVRFGMKTGKPLTGSASGVKSISLRQAGEALTQGIVTTRGGKLQFAPEGLAMALPTGKVAKAGFSLLRKSNIAGAEAVARRLAAKAAGRSAGRDIAAAGGKKYLDSEMGKFSILGGGAKAKISEGSFMRKASERVYQRAPKNNLGDLEFLPGMTKTQAAQKMAYGTDLAKRPTFRTGGAGPRLPEAGSVEMVKKTAKQFGQKVSGKEAKNISRLLRGRGR